MATFLDLLNDNLQIKLTTVRNTPTSMLITWSLPTEILAYNGAIVLLSTSPISPTTLPVQGQTYLASSDFNAPASTLGGANVVSALYDNTSHMATVMNLNPTVNYYAAIYICDSVKQYAPAVLSYSLDTTNPDFEFSEPSGSLPESYAPPTNPTLGMVYYNPANNKVNMWNGSAWQEVLSSTVTTGTTFPTGTAYTGNPTSSNTIQGSLNSNGYSGNITPLPGPVLAGTFFFNTDNKVLYLYDGTNWNKANTNQPEVPLYEKIPTGTSGDDKPRIDLVGELKNQLGWPKMCVELAEDQFNLAVNLALRELRRRSDSAYHRKHMLFGIHPNQPTYYLNDPTDGSDRIVDVIKIHRITQFGINAIGGDNGVYSQTFFNQVFQAGQMIDLLSIFLIAQLGEEYTKMFAGDLQYEFTESTRELRILRKLYKEEVVVLEATMERTEQDLLKDRWNRNWLYDWALACCYEMLGAIRGKYQALPGANSISLNGAELSQKAETMKIDLLRQITDFELGNNVAFGSSWILLG